MSWVKWMPKGLVCQEQELLPTLHLELGIQSRDVADAPGVSGQFAVHLSTCGAALPNSLLQCRSTLEDVEDIFS